MKSKIKHYMPLIIAVLLLICFISIYAPISGYRYNSDIDCVDSSFAYGKTLFKLEDDEKELIYYSSKYNDYVVKGELKKKKIFGKTKYKTTSLQTQHPYETNEWIIFNDYIKYIVLKYESHINYIDCEGYEPVGYKLSWINGDGEESGCWIYVIDKSTQNADN